VPKAFRSFSRESKLRIGTISGFNVLFAHSATTEYRLVLVCYDVCLFVCMVVGWTLSQFCARLGSLLIVAPSMRWFY
jgi:hypothetical protein